MIHLQQVFKARFGADPTVARAPGYINLMGDFLDYNEGIVLPAAINAYTTVAVSARTDKEIHLLSPDSQQLYEYTFDKISSSKEEWSHCLPAVIRVLLQRGYTMSGFNACVHHAQMYSPTAGCCAVVTALAEVFAMGLSKWDIAQVAQEAMLAAGKDEGSAVATFASVFGRKNRVIRLDCRNFDYTYSPVSLGAYELVLFDPGLPQICHPVFYKEYREASEVSLQLIREKHPHVRSLSYVTQTMITECIADAVLQRRCMYVLNENRRVQAAYNDLVAGRLTAFGQKLFASHAGMRDDFGISSSELDLLVAIADSLPAVIVQAQRYYRYTTACMTQGQASGQLTYECCTPCYCSPGVTIW